MRLILFYLILLLLSKRHALCQSLYQQNQLFHDKNNFYAFGIKHVNGSNKNKTKDGYEHNSDFYISKFDGNGEKQWELLIDKNREFIPDLTDSKISKRGALLYTLVAFRNVNREKRISFTDHYLIEFDTLGHITHEKKLKDSTFYKYSSIFYDKDFIYITLDKSGVICEKYDYNFNLIKIITNPAFVSFFYNSKIFRLEKSYISIGPLNDMDQVIKEVRNKSKSFDQPKAYGIRKINGNLTEAPKITTVILPSDEQLGDSFYSDGKFDLLTQSTSENILGSKYKIYTYNENTSKLDLFTDTLTRRPLFFRSFSNNGLLYITQAVVFVGENRRDPESIFYIKNGKQFIHNLGLRKNKASFKFEFRLINNTLFIYEVNYTGENILVEAFDYENKKFLK